MLLVLVMLGCEPNRSLTKLLLTELLNTANTMQRPRNKLAENLVIRVSTFPAPAPSAMSNAPPPNARPEPDSFLGN